MSEYGWKDAEILCVKCKIGLTKYAFVSVCSPVCVWTKKGKNVREKFRNELNKFLKCLKDCEGK